MKCLISFSAWHTSYRLQISCNSLVQSVISSVVETVTNQSLASIDMYYKRYQKPDKERYRLQAYNVVPNSLLLFSCKILLVIATLQGNTG